MYNKDCIKYLHEISLQKWVFPFENIDASVSKSKAKIATVLQLKCKTRFLTCKFEDFHLFKFSKKTETKTLKLSFR